MAILRPIYVAAFGAAAVVCLAALFRTDRIESRDTRRGLRGLLILSGVWAATEAGRIAVRSVEFVVPLYLLGLTTGLATVGAWLYFCSAYAGLDYHRRPVARWSALTAFLVVVTVKLTNPIHGLYFSTALVSTPFEHFQVEFGPFHWIVTGLAYALSAVGFYVLYDLFADSGFDTTSLGAVVSLAALPVVLDLVGLLGPSVVRLNYEPLGVAAFAVGVLYFVEEKFVAVPTFGRTQVFDRIDDPVFLLDRHDVVRDYNAAAGEIFSISPDESGRPIETVVPAVAAAGADEVVSVSRGDETRHYLLEEAPLSVGATDIGRALVLTDVTAVERQRRELERQNEQLDDFADAITHELRNTLGIVQGHASLIETRLPAEVDTGVHDPLAAIERATERMTRIVGDLAVLARHGQTLDDVDSCAFREVVRSVWAETDGAGMTLTIEGDGIVSADASRFEELFREAFAFARANDAGEITVALDEDGITITDDGDPLSATDIDAAFSYGSAVPTAEAGMALPNVRTMARVHGWTTEIVPRYTDGVRLRIVGLTVEPTRGDVDRRSEAERSSR